MQIRYSLLGLLVASPVLASPGVTEEDMASKAEILPSSGAGAMLPYTHAARHDRKGILISTYGGFDQSKGAPVMQGSLDATFIDRITLRAATTNTGMSNQLQPAFGVIVDLLREADIGIDLAIGGEYDRMGWNRSPAGIARTAIGTTVGELRLQGNAALGMSTENGERYGDLRLSGLHPVGGGLFAGLDSRARVDLARDMDEPTGELDWDMQAGPVATYAIGRFAVSATGGVSAWKLRSGDSTNVGAVGAVGLGAAF